MDKPVYSISTPENVDLHLELAGLGNRVLACLIDTLLTWCACIALFLLVWLATTLVALSNLGSSVVAVISGLMVLGALLASFFIVFGYYIIFEGMWHGQTPGKKVCQIRVIDQNGQPITWGAAVLRNIIRVFDTGFMLIGMLIALIDKNERRFGDFAAGTLVVRERASDFSTQAIKISTFAKEGALNLDVGRINPQEYELLLTFLKRREVMTKQQRPTLAKQLETHFRNKLSEPSNGLDAPETFLERVYVAYQSRAL